MLPTTYRYTAYNDTGGTSDITVEEQTWKFDSSGNVSYGTWTNRLSTTGTTSGTLATGSTIDNSTDKYIGANILVSATGSGTSGVVTVFLEFSDDGGTTWPDAQEGIPIGSLDAGDTNVVMVA
jgi:hypothetical protein